MGPAHPPAALWLLQHGTKLYLVRARHLVQELFYQRAVARFGALPRRALTEPAPIAALVLMVRRCNSKPVFKARWFQRLKLKYHKLPSTFALNVNLRRYNPVPIVQRIVTQPGVVLQGGAGAA